MKKPLELSEFMFIVDEDAARKSFFEQIRPGENTKGEKLDEHSFYRIVKSSGDDQLYGIEIRIGEDSKYSPEVIDSNDFEIKKNPKTKEMIETDNQVLLFFEINTKTKANRMWTNKSIYNNKVKEIFFQKTGIEKDLINIIRVYENPENFLEKLSKINNLTFSVKPDTVFNNKDLTNEIESMIGFGEGVRQYTIQAAFRKNRKVGAVAKEKLLNLIYRKNQCEIEGLIIAGKDDEDNSMILNRDYVTNKIRMNHIYPDDNGFFRFEDVKDDMEKRIK